MAEEKKVVVTLLNKSKRHFDTLNAEGKPVRHAPGRTEEYTAEQAAQFDPRELVDLSKVPGSVDKETLRTENVALKKRNAELEAQLAALTPAPAAEVAPEPEPLADAELETAEAGESGRGRKRK